MYQSNQLFHFPPLLGKRPQAEAFMKGDAKHPFLRGIVQFRKTPRGILIISKFTGLPTPEDVCMSPVFGFHIHSGTSCSGTESDPFSDALTHYNPGNCPHPYHAGDLPPIFSCRGFGFSAVLTDRFTLQEVIGKTVILHSAPDDFTTQPSGNSGQKIACGIIQKIKGRG